ncbi:MAG: hypothetical protein ACRCYQ_14510 [Nocardioides sp.]
MVRSEAVPGHLPGQAAASGRRVRELARDAARLMVFSAVTSACVVIGLVALVRLLD